MQLLLKVPNHRAFSQRRLQRKMGMRAGIDLDHKSRRYSCYNRFAEAVAMDSGMKEISKPNLDLSQKRSAQHKETQAKPSSTHPPE